MPVSQSRICSLDGTRAISIGLVIVAHLGLTRYVPGLWRLDAGNLGVRVFFVISGFIITSLLLAELSQARTISLLSFYRRRAFRILPAYYTFLGIVMLLSAFSGGPATWANVWPAAIFVADYDVNVPLAVGHTWSLAVEEQFYLLWPSAMVLLGLRRAFIGCIGILLFAPLFRVLAEKGIWPTSPRYAFECVADALAVGCVLAIVRARLWENSVYRKFLRSPMSLLPLLTAIFIIAAKEDKGVIYLTAGLSILNLGIAIALDRYMRMPELLIGRFLNFPPIVWLGFVSYSLYLWQQVFAWAPIPTALKLLLIFGCATISYYAIERPFLRLRRWLEDRRMVSSDKQPGTVS
jgi:peptidoglycan/LPS O-acetylase OafA/YrhL